LIRKTLIKLKFLKYREGKPTINAIKLISKPNVEFIIRPNKFGKSTLKSFIIFSTNKGLKTVTDCKKLKLGGEPL
jgi:ribosomal protein S8